jgi:sugar phosphate isomerase/epimerase
MNTGLSRRAVLAAAGVCLCGRAQPPQPRNGRLKIAVFSKHLQFLAGGELAAAAARIGFDGIDITVRKGGHVEPERVRQDLPALAAQIRSHGLEVPMITTDIADAATPYAEDILRTMAELGVRRYRWAGFRYDPEQPYPPQLERLKHRIAALAALNARYQACAMYHTHSGRDLVGASIWDLFILLKEFDPNAVGVNYDVAHAMIEGGLGGWINSFRVTGPYVRGIAVKDFAWGKDGKGEWQPQWKPLGQGMVRFPEFLAMVKRSGFDGPVQMHFEYPMGNAPEDVYSAMKRDLAQLRGYLGKVGL